MPRVTTHTKSDRGKRTYSCSECHRTIEPDQRYYKWTRRFGGRSRGTDYFQHMDCGYPKPSSLSGAKTAVIEDAKLDASKEISEWSPTLEEPDFSAVQEALQSVADTAREVGSEYEDGVNNMPDSLQYGPTGEAMQEVAQELESWADELESWEPDSDEPDELERGEDESDDDFADRRQEALDRWAGDVRDVAEDAMGEVPTYNG